MAIQPEAANRAYKTLTEVRQILREVTLEISSEKEKIDEADDLICNVLDQLVGYCLPEYRLGQEDRRP